MRRGTQTARRGRRIGTPRTPWAPWTGGTPGTSRTGGGGAQQVGQRAVAARLEVDVDGGGLVHQPLGHVTHLPLLLRCSAHKRIKITHISSTKSRFCN